MRRPLFWTLTACCVALAGPPAGARAQAAGPAWSVTSLSEPTAFSAADSSFETKASEDCRSHAENSVTCDQFDIRVANVGGAPATGPVTVTDTLSAGLTTQATPHSVLAAPGLETTEEGWKCAPGAGLSTVSCTYPLPVPALGQLPPLEIPIQIGTVAPDTYLTNKVEVSGGGAASVRASSRVLVEPSNATAFGFEQFSSYLADPAGAPATQAGGHPNALYTSIELNSVLGSEEGFQPARPAKDLVFELPLGLVGDPLATPRCPLGQLAPPTLAQVEATPTGSGCSPETRVGTVTLDAIGGKYYESFPVYNLLPEKGYPAEFGFVYLKNRLVMFAGVAHTAAGYVLRVSVPGIPEIAAFQGAEVTFFGDPTREDSEGALPGEAFFTDPSACSGQPLRTALHADAWEDPAPVPLDANGAPDLDAPDFSEAQWQKAVSEAPPVSGCEALRFEPSFSFQPDSAEEARAASPAGYTFELHIPQEHITEPEALATPDLKQAVVALPEGLVADPSFAGGLEACSEAQVGLENTQPASCPKASKVATVEVSTPLLEHPLPGSVYLATPHQNPFDSLLAGYLVIDDPLTGIVVKLAGQIELNPSTGRITATFDENPQFPLEKVKVAFEGGARAPLTNPATCGMKTTQAEWTPWSAPQSGPPFADESSFQIASGPQNRATCIYSEHEEPNSPGFTAGSVSSQAGAYTPFVLTLTRENGSQVFKGLEMTLPPGLLGKIAGVQQCPQADIEAAERGSGRGQQASPSCPAASEVGVVAAGAGSGTPYYAQGHAYLAGPYDGAPFSLAIVTPAVAGPFDLGTVVVRAGLYVNPETAQVTVRSAPIPTILDGVPLDIKSIYVYVNREDFTFNPTNCAAKSIAGTLTAAFSTAQLSVPSPVAGCAALAFKPTLRASTKAQASKAGGASLKLIGTSTPGGHGANLAKLDLQVPLQLPARLTTLQKACTEKQFAANPAGCPAGSAIGTATVHTPVLNVPVSGPIYLVSHGGAAFPDVETVLQGEGVTVVLDGKTDIKKGITYSNFEAVPDVPFTSFEAVLPEGPHSIFGTNLPTDAGYDLCGQKLTLPATLVAQNGAVFRQSTPIAVEGCPDRLSIAAHAVRGRRLTLAVLVPAAGRLTASGRGLSSAAKSTRGSEIVQLTLREKRSGRLQTRVKLSFVPSKGRRLAKTLAATFKR